MMSEVGDGLTLENDLRKKAEEISEISEKTDDLEIKMLKIQPRQYKRNMLIDAQKSIAFLEYQSLVDFVETDGEYIVSAGRDHDVNIWDAVEGTHIRRLSGHSGPVTGLYLHDSRQIPSEKVIVTSSEDGTIRQWSLNKGEEFSKFETENLITCMGVINNVIAVSGNHKGYMEVRHLETGDLYSTILAHLDPIDALAVEGNYACSATFDAPSCLKVWEIQFEQTTCIYRIENKPEFEFGSLAIWNTTAILGSSDEQKLHIVNFKTDVKESIDLHRSPGKVQHVRVWNNWILSCSASNKDVVLDVHRINNYEHFGTFRSNMQQVFAIAAMESDSNLKIILGGAALVILGFHFNVMQGAMKIPFKRSAKSEKSSLIHYKKRGHYTMKNAEIDEYPDEKLTDSEESESSSDDEKTYKTYTSLSVQQHSDSTKILETNTECTKESNIEYINDITNISNRSITTSAVPVMTMVPISSHNLFVEKHLTEDIFEHTVEPRIIAKKLAKLLDEEEQQVESEECAKIYENYESSKEIIDNIMKKYTESTDEDIHTIYEENAESKSDCETNTGTNKTQENEQFQLLKGYTNDLNTGEFENFNIIPEDKNEKSEKVKCKFYFKKIKQPKSDKKKSEKSKHKCKIM